MTARQLVYTGKIIDAGEASHFGFVERMASPEQLDACVALGGAMLERMSIADTGQQGIRASGMTRA